MSYIIQLYLLLCHRKNRYNIFKRLRELFVPILIAHYSEVPIHCVTMIYGDLHTITVALRLFLILHNNVALSCTLGQL